MIGRHPESLDRLDSAAPQIHHDRVEKRREDSGGRVGLDDRTSQQNRVSAHRTGGEARRPGHHSRRRVEDRASRAITVAGDLTACPPFESDVGDPRLLLELGVTGRGVRCACVGLPIDAASRSWAE